MRVEKRFYDSNGSHFILIGEQDGLIRFVCFDDSMNTSSKVFDVYFEDDTALELSRQLYHTLKNMKNGGRNEG